MPRALARHLCQSGKIIVRHLDRRVFSGAQQIDLVENFVKAPPPDTGGGFTQPAQSALLRMGLFGQQGFEQRALLVVDQDMNIVGNTDRSEEHTSELQSLMRISYAVFCLKKKKKDIRHPRQTKLNT